MKTFNKTFLLLLIVPLLFSTPLRVDAEELTILKQDEIISSIDSLDAIVKDCKRLNIREKPSTSSKVVGKIDCGEHLTIIDQEGKWFKITYEDISGYVFWEYISFTEEEISEDSNLIGNSIIHYTSSENRDHNISLACKTINGTILEPGDEFRWSSIVGSANKDKGYLKASVISNGRYVQGYGGGVCQVSTTIYNALLDTTVEPTERHGHSLGCSYAKKDATVAYGYKDFAFDNTYNFPIEIEAYSYKSVVFVNIYRMEEEY